MLITAYSVSLFKVDHRWKALRLLVGLENLGGEDLFQYKVSAAKELSSNLILSTALSPEEQ